MRVIDVRRPMPAGYLYNMGGIIPAFFCPYEEKFVPAKARDGEALWPDPFCVLSHAMFCPWRRDRHLLRG